MPVTSPDQFGKLLSAPEGTRLEFRSARMSYEFDKLSETGPDFTAKIVPRADLDDL